MSKADLGEMVGLTGATVGNYEAGRTEPPYAILAALAKALGVDPGWLAFGDAEPEKVYVKPHPLKTPKELEKPPRATRRKGNG